jgi:Cu/Ag efflux protein CusF
LIGRLPSRDEARALLLLVALASGCDRTPSYTGIGDLVAVDRATLRVTIRHDDIRNLMPAMTMAFAVDSPGVLVSAVVGTRVRFELVRRGDNLVVTRLAPLGAAGGREAGNP